ncbi:conserved hypothetical protein [Pseudomonas sp. 8BK]|nr:conserved hypothetical protein [Pseudomonas sp. 8BK]
MILAFRDLQWMVKQHAVMAKAVQLLTQKSQGLASLPENQRGADLLTSPPPLLAKLDGRAESASGDVLTSNGARFFLLEFKSEKAKLATEKGKFILDFMKFIDPQFDLPFIELSRNGHFVVYPTFPKGRKAPDNGFMPVHETILEAQPYYDALTGPLRQEADPDFYVVEPTTVRGLLWSSNSGLLLEDMAAYLWALCKAHDDEGGNGHPMKAVIASADGFYWPVADLSDLIQFAHYFEQRPASENSINLIEERRKELVPTIEAFIWRESTEAADQLDAEERKPSSELRFGR